jgi:hypothetical protein
MSDQLVEIFEYFDDSLVMEMTGDGASGLVPLRPELVAEIIQGDDDPKFATYVIESGWSKSKRFWGPELFHDVVSEINNSVQGGEAVVGYMGHIPKEQDSYSFPPIQLQWVGAKIVHNSGDKAKMAVKAYILPGTDARNYINRKNPLIKTVSWRGKVQQEVMGQGVKIKKFLLESIDLARPRTAGMSARLVGPLTSEMEDNERSDTVKPEEILALQENELRAHNPGLVQGIEANARKPLETQVSEMTDAATKTKPTLDLIPQFRTLLGLDDATDDLNTVQAVISQLRAHGKQLRDSVLDKVLLNKLTGGEERDRILVRSLIATEMRDRNVMLSGKEEDEEKDEKIVSEMVNSIIDSSDQLKEIVSEMSGTPPTLPTTEKPRGTSRELKVGMSTRSIRVRSASR